MGSIPIFSTNDLSFTLSCFSERHSTRVFLVFLIAGIAWGKSEHNIPISVDKVCGQKTTLHYSKVSFHHRWEVLSWEDRVDVISSFSYWLMEKEWGSQSGSSHLQGFFRLVYTNLKSFRTSCDTQASLLPLFWETDLPLYAWGPAYYRDRSLTETHSEPSVSLLFF